MGIDPADNLGFNKGRDKRNRISFHIIRHTVATNLARQLDIRGLMDIMGWRVAEGAAERLVRAFPARPGRYHRNPGHRLAAA